MACSQAKMMLASFCEDPWTRKSIIDFALNPQVCTIHGQEFLVQRGLSSPACGKQCNDHSLSPHTMRVSVTRVGKRVGKAQTGRCSILRTRPVMVQHQCAHGCACSSLAHSTLTKAALGADTCYPASDPGGMRDQKSTQRRIAS